MDVFADVHKNCERLMAQQPKKHWSRKRKERFQQRKINFKKQMIRDQEEWFRRQHKFNPMLN